MQTLPVALIHDIAVSLMGVGVVLIIHERVGTGDEQAFKRLIFPISAASIRSRP